MIYLDNAATSFPKPQSVIIEQTRCMREYCGNPGRGAHKLAMQAAEKIFECRGEIASMFGANNPSNVIFTMNTTMALNMAIKGMLQTGDHVLLSDMEHNAVFRPIYKLASEGRISYSIFKTHVCDAEWGTKRLCEEIEAMIQPQTKMLICAHVPNICSAVFPMEEIGSLCRRKGILFVVDAAQSAGHIPIDIEQMRIDALCAPGHKGLLGPQGSGFLLLGRDIYADTLLEGGSGFHSLDATMPTNAPERYEAGTLATPAIAGLCEGIRAVKRFGVEKIGSHEKEWNQELFSQLSAMPNVQIYAPKHLGAVLLFNMEGYTADWLGKRLNDLGFCVRAGYHCSALGHATLKTPLGGAVRVSPGIFNTEKQVSELVRAIKWVGTHA